MSNFKDRYNTIEPNEDENNYKQILNAKLAIAPSSKESLEQYLVRIKIYQKIASDLNWKTHVDNPYKTWHTHKNPAGCFMCQDTQFITVLIQVLELILNQYPTLSFNKSES